MKKIALIALPVLIILSCNHQKLKELEAQNLKLSTEVSLMDSTINEYLFTIESIEDNLGKIKEKENLIQLKQYYQTTFQNL